MLYEGSIIQKYICDRWALTCQLIKVEDVANLLLAERGRYRESQHCPQIKQIDSGVIFKIIGKPQR
jgi:hypothetical protein